MSNQSNHERLADEGLLIGELAEHHQAALNSLSGEENDQLISILKKVKSAMPTDRKEDAPNIF
ncbi:MAG: hypothetical protein OEM63_05845 [Gammaproteobacteria bacterium]|nr:hypothetical protein [Gammaproteobacteria bacterium]